MVVSPEQRAAREAVLEAAGFNICNLDPVDVPVDLFTDVPTRSFVESVARAGNEGATQQTREPEPSAAASAIYGPARFVMTAKGRSAEVALVAGLELKGKTILTHGLWKTTELALLHHGNRIELVPRERETGTANLDLAHLSTRLAAGPVGAVFIEPANGQLAGWNIDVENVRAIANLCRKHGALLLMDATRLLANCVALGLPPLESAAEF